MTVAFAWALLGLLLVPILILLDRWRRKPRETEWPSLLLWRKVAASQPAARRRMDRPLLYECLAVTFLSLAAAGPGFVVASTTRSATILLDTGPHMQARRADGTTVLDATRAEVDRIVAAAGGATITEAPRGLATEAAGLPGDLRVIATDREGIGGEGLIVVGRAADGFNLGIDAVQVDGDQVWFVVATDGPEREVTVRVDDQLRKVRTGHGVAMVFAESIEIVDEDNYDGDDRVQLRRIALPARNDTGSKLVDAALLKAGTPTTPGDALVVTAKGGTPIDGIVRGADCTVVGGLSDGLFEGLFLDECVWSVTKTRADVTPLLLHGDRPIAGWLDEETLWLGMDVDREWDDHATLAVLIEHAKRARLATQLAKNETRVGDAVATPQPGLVWTRGVDRPWNGELPEVSAEAESTTSLRTLLALLAAGVLVLYLRTCLRG